MSAGLLPRRSERSGGQRF